MNDDTKDLEAFVRPTQPELFERLHGMYSGKATASLGEYLLVAGTAPVMLAAHLDTVHETPVVDIVKSEGGNIWTSPQGIGGDDRCGVYALVQVYERAAVKPWLLFACDEEIGRVGADAFARDYAKGALPQELDALKFIVELDRMGSRDAVYYDCANDAFEDYITGKGYVTEFGSYSDISVVAPALGVAAVNLSSGYHDPHRRYERIDLRELDAVIESVLGIVADAASERTPRYEYVSISGK